MDKLDNKSFREETAVASSFPLAVFSLLLLLLLLDVLLSCCFSSASNLFFNKVVFRFLRRMPSSDVIRGRKAEGEGDLERDLERDLDRGVRWFERCGE